MTFIFLRYRRAVNRAFPSVTDGTSYQFGSRIGGLVIYSIPEPKPDTVEDRLAFGFVTTDTDSTIVKILSANSKDFTEVVLTVSFS